MQSEAAVPPARTIFHIMHAAVTAAADATATIARTGTAQPYCLQCLPGYACGNSSALPVACTAGSYASGNATACTPCPAGSFCSDTGSSPQVRTLTSTVHHTAHCAKHGCDTSSSLVGDRLLSFLTHTP
jgi:hypothetical protein